MENDKDDDGDDDNDEGSKYIGNIVALALVVWQDIRKHMRV